MDRFVPGSAAHIAPLLATLGIAALAIACGRGAPEAVRRRWEIAAGAASIATVLFLKSRLALFDHPPVSWLPLNVCDWSNVAAGMALITPVRFWRILAYYFGLGLSSIAVLVPDIAGGPGTAEYWLFWVRHAVILAIAIYDLGGRGFRPRWRDYGVWCAVGLAYIPLAWAINQSFGTNFGFIGDATLENTAVIQAFGPWPQRAFVMLGLAFAQGALLTVLWYVLPGRLARANRPD